MQVGILSSFFHECTNALDFSMKFHRYNRPFSQLIAITLLLGMQETETMGDVRLCMSNCPCFLPLSYSSNSESFNRFILASLSTTMKSSTRNGFQSSSLSSLLFYPALAPFLADSLSRLVPVANDMLVMLYMLMSSNHAIIRN